MIPNPANKAVEPSQQFDRQLTSHLAEKHVSHTRVAATLDQLRAACAQTLLQSIDGESARSAESRLWNAHQKVNAYYRGALASLRKSGDAKLVHRRRVENDYFKFIKASQKFYRSYIFDLSQTYGGIPELEQVAMKLKTPHSAAAANQLEDTSAAHECILRSCHQTLIQLGDLSRYREMELASEAPNFGPAIGFYDLAGAVCPSLGTSENQLAVIALAEGNFFRSTYHLYRSLSTSQPHPQAEGNLRKAYFKISNAWDRHELVPTGTAAPSDILVGWYLRLISKLFHGKAFAEHDELESEVIDRLQDSLKHAEKYVLRRLVLINMAAYHFAQVRFQGGRDADESMQAFLYYLRLNIRTMSTLLRTLIEQMQDVTAGNMQGSETTSNLAAKISTPMQMTLPNLRLYTIWLEKNASVVANAPGLSLSLQTEFWSSYASCLSIMAKEYPAGALKEVEYLLEEDADTLNFQPLHCDDTQAIWQLDSRTKPQRHLINQEARWQPAIEHLARIRHFLQVGIHFAVQKEDIPLDFDARVGEFTYRGAREASDIQHEKEIAETDSVTLLKVPNEPVEPDHQDVQAMRMVDDLVGSMEGTSEPLLVPNTSISLSPEHNRPANSSVFDAGSCTIEALLHADAEAMTKEHDRLSPQAKPFLPTVASRSDRTSTGHSPRMPGLRRNSRNSVGSHTPISALHLAHNSPRGHYRVNSTESLRSARSLWTTDEYEHDTPESASHLAAHSPLGNGTFGFTTDELMPSKDTIPASPALFGASQSPWTMTGAESQRLVMGGSHLSTPVRQPHLQG